jgi:pSer/pThr/pTyr-binding forkhead associated (FHA) protein
MITANVGNTRILNTAGDTLSIKDTLLLRKSVSTLRTPDAFMDEQMVYLVIRGLMEKVRLTEKQAAVIGRGDLNTGYKPDIDLTPYGARVRGISRAHARLHVQNGHLYVSDLGSDNGTFVAGNRLAADVPYQLRSGEELILGCLNMRVIFQI